MCTILCTTMNCSKIRTKQGCVRKGIIKFIFTMHYHFFFFISLSKSIKKWVCHPSLDYSSFFKMLTILYIKKSFSCSIPASTLMRWLWVCVIRALFILKSLWYSMKSHLSLSSLVEFRGLENKILFYSAPNPYGPFFI